MSNKPILKLQNFDIGNQGCCDVCDSKWNALENDSKPVMIINTKLGTIYVCETCLEDAISSIDFYKFYGVL